MIKKVFWLSFWVAFILLIASCAPKPEPLPKTKTYIYAFEAQRDLHVKGYKVFPITGTGSMEPLIPKHPAGDQIIVGYAGVDSTTFDELKPGNVVIYKVSEKKYIIHRLGQKKHNGWFVYGIANKGDDDTLVTKRNFIGKVAFINLIFWK